MIIRVVSSDHIVCWFQLERALSPEQVFNANPCFFSMSYDILETMPIGEERNVEMHFLKPSLAEYDEEGMISVEKAEECSRLKLLSDPYALLTMNLAAPSFAEKYPSVTSWKGPSGEDAYMFFDHWGDGLYVTVSAGQARLSKSYWLAGLLIN